MTITREQVQDLREGDVVELSGLPILHGATVRGPLWADGESQRLAVGTYIVRHRDGSAPTQWEGEDFTLTVIERAPRPLYANHDRTEPVQGDVVRFEDDRYPGNSYTDLYDPLGSPDRPWRDIQHGDRWTRSEAEQWSNQHMKLRLLVDGETGQVVP